MRKLIIWLMELTANDMKMYTTGSRAIVSGLYSSYDSKEIIPLAKGERFPPYKSVTTPWFLLFKV